MANARTAAPKLETISRLPAVPQAVPPVLFVHGAWHAAWCWEEHFLDHFAAHGFAAHALSLRGHGGSEGRAKLRTTRIRDFVADLASVVATLPSPPILIGHSMGGFVIQKYLQTAAAPAAVLLASVPPTGVWRTLARTMRDSPIDVLKCNLTFSLWPVISNVEKARNLLFSPSLPPELATRYQRQLQDEAWFGYLDSLIFDLVDPKRVTTPMLVMGAKNDAMVHPGEVVATARAYHVEPTLFDGVSHDMMLGSRWRDVADEIIAQLDVRFRRRSPAEVARLKAA